jgi:hypothetical protein
MQKNLQNSIFNISNIENWNEEKINKSIRPYNSS